MKFQKLLMSTATPHSSQLTHLTLTHLITTPQNLKINPNTSQPHTFITTHTPHNPYISQPIHLTTHTPRNSYTSQPTHQTTHTLPHNASRRTTPHNEQPKLLTSVLPWSLCCCRQYWNQQTGLSAAGQHSCKPAARQI